MRPCGVMKTDVRYVRGKYIWRTYEQGRCQGHRVARAAQRASVRGSRPRCSTATNGACRLVRSSAAAPAHIFLGGNDPWRFRLSYVPGVNAPHPASLAKLVCAGSAVEWVHRGGLGGGAGGTLTLALLALALALALASLSLCAFRLRCCCLTLLQGSHPLLGHPLPLGFGLGGRLLLARRGRVYSPPRTSDERP